jgi:hypothetical protein
VAEDGGISLGELAEQRSISKDAARRLVKAGTVPAHRPAGTHGPAWCGHPDGNVPERNGGAGDAPGLRNGPATMAQPEDVAALVALVDRLTIENRELVGAVAAWQAQAVALAGRLADAEQQLALDVPISPLVAPGEPKTVEVSGATSTAFSLLLALWRWLVIVLVVVVTTLVLILVWSW